MRFNPLKATAQVMTCLILVAITTAHASTPQSRLPNPVLYLVGVAPAEVRGKAVIRYTFAVENFSVYPDAMFAASPELPPCGTNTKASRTWVDVYDQSGKRFNGFCAFGKASNLNSIWFALEPDVVPPSWIYIELNDRQTSTKYKSNLAETSL